MLDALCVCLFGIVGELDGQDVCCVIRVLLGDGLDVYGCVPVDVRCAYLFTNGHDVCVNVVVCGRVGCVRMGWVRCDVVLVLEFCFILLEANAHM